MINRQPVMNGVTMFVTLNTWNHRQVFIHPDFAKKAIDYLYALMKKHDFTLFSFVVMPDHIHLLLKVNAPSTITVLMNDYRTGLSFELGTGAFFEEHYDLRMPQKPAEKLVYMHDKPFKAGLSDTPKEYPWSSASGTWGVSTIKS